MPETSSPKKRAAESAPPTPPSASPLPETQVDQSPSSHRIHPRFAEAGTGWPDATNLQKAFWMSACDAFDALADETQRDDPDLAFIPRATVVIALAGTSLSQLLGQQYSTHVLSGDEAPRTGRTPEPGVLVEKLRPHLDLAEIEDRLKVVWHYYDAIRHFSAYKYESLEGDYFAGNKLCEIMETCRDLWKVVGDYGWEEAERARYLNRSFQVAEGY